jgi:hypothetical protein
LVELRTDYGSADGRTVQGRPYLWFHSLEDGRLRKRIKVIPLSLEEAVGFVELYLPYFLEASGQPDAVQRIHEFFSGCGFDVRANTGLGTRKFNRRAHPAARFSVRRFVRKFAFWRKGAP